MHEFIEIMVLMSKYLQEARARFPGSQLMTWGYENNIDVIIVRSSSIITDLEKMMSKHFREKTSNNQQ